MELSKKSVFVDFVCRRGVNSCRPAIVALHLLPKRVRGKNGRIAAVGKPVQIAVGPLPSIPAGTTITGKLGISRVGLNAFTKGKSRRVRVSVVLIVSGQLSSKIVSKTVTLSR